MNKLLLTFAILATAATTYAGDMKHEMPPPYTGSVELQKLKSLAGMWKGISSDPHNGDNNMAIEYKVTGNGSSVVETIAPGSPMEMTTVYYDKDGKLAMTHYCALGNRPEMAMTASDGNSITLSLVNGGEVSENETHMHSLKLIIPDADHLTHEWSYYENGAQAATTTFTLTRAR